MAITWTKNWSASDDGVILKGSDLKNIQDDVSSGIEGNATTIQDVPVEAPVAGDDGKALYYDHAGGKFDYITIIPSGLILMWSGSVATIPSGWVICDGNNGTPDLTDRFVIHADADAAGTNNVGDTGGASTHTHGAGSYNVDKDTFFGQRDFVEGYIAVSEDAGEGKAPRSNSDFTVSGTSASGDNVPKYYALAYIMKT